MPLFDPSLCNTILSILLLVPYHTVSWHGECSFVLVDYCHYWSMVCQWNKNPKMEGIRKEQEDIVLYLFIVILTERYVVNF
jgi:hypothetical protein